MNSDRFLSGLCCVAAASPKTLRLVFRDQSVQAADVREDQYIEEAREEGDETIRTRASQALLNVSLFRDGYWVTTQIDDRLPCSQGGELLAPHCEDGGGKLWPAIVEKALAAVLGGYDKFGSHAIVEDVPSALVQCTGGQVRTFNLASELVLMWMQNGYLWSSLKSWCAQSASGEVVVVCVSHVKREDQYDVASLWGPSAQWLGTMGSSSPELEALPLDHDEFGSAQHSIQGRSEDNSFWILFEDWVAHFSTLHVWSLVPHNWHISSLRALF